MADTHVWVGQSGRRYDYEIFHRGYAPNIPQACVVIMAKHVRSSWVVVHIAYAEKEMSFGPGTQTPLKDCIDRERPTHIHVGRRPRIGLGNLKDEIEDIRAKHRPLCDGLT